MKILSLLVIHIVMLAWMPHFASAQEVDPNGYPSGTADNGLTEVLPEDIAPTFTKATVTKLNAIVRRSLNAIDLYDELRRDVKAAPKKHGMDQTQDALASMDAEAKSALKDMQAEVKRLEASDEIYNAVVLAGMVTFVTRVEAEIAETRKSGFKL